jgi:streptogramin lyase
VHRLGAGSFSYAVEPQWARLPPDMSMGDAAGVAVDENDNVYVFNRGEHPVIVLDRKGDFLRSWGGGTFKRPHGIDIGPDGCIYCTDDGDHTVRKFTPTGAVLLEIGLPGLAAPSMSGRPFNRCTHTALSPKGDIYVSDGYGNAHVHQFSPNGRRLRTWGGAGSEPGQFDVPHNICCDAHGWVYVADRENNRIQIFRPDGGFETLWAGLRRPSAMCLERGPGSHVFIGQLAPFLPVEQLRPDQGPRVSILTSQGEVAACLGADLPGVGATRFVAPHGIAVDSAGNIFLGEVTRAAWGHHFPGIQCPNDVTILRKLAKIRSGQL